jgi:S1-C subfamily serine protease
LVATAEASPQEALERNVVKLIVTKRAPDLGRPWTKSAPAGSSGSGVFLADGRILTNAHVAMHASQVFVQLRQGGDRLAAKVTALAPGIDLALVELEDPSQVDVPGLPLADALPETKTHVSAYGYPAGGDNLSVTDGIVSRIEFAGYYYGVAAARIQVDAALNPGNSGGPAIQDGHIVGLVFSKIEAADNIGYLIPAEEIRRFLDDVADGRYDGSWMLYDEVQAGENAALRAFLKLPPEVTGVVVTRPYGDAPDYPLQRWDVITKIGPHPIDNQGYVDVRPGLRMRYQYFVPLLASNGQIALTVLRGGETLEVQAPVLREAERLVPMLKEKYPEYFIYGPLTFTVATQEHVGAVGARGLAALAAFDSPLIKRFSEKPAVPGEELVVIATRNFPHPLTKGYEDRVMGVIESLNGEAVRNLRHLAELLRDSQEEYLIFDIAGRGESFVFPRTDMRDSTEEILVDEGIRYQASESLRDIWED